MVVTTSMGAESVPARRHSRRHGWGIAVMITLVAALLFLVTHPYALGDWVRLRGYQPSADIVAIVGDTTMTDVGERLFYINRPGLEDKPTFRQSCPNADEKTIIIGCYRGGQRGVHILAVDDPRLAGVEEVTAAHEMLHAAYDRLKGGDKEQVNQWLTAYAATGLKDERILKALENYRRTEPGQELNEMHSMFGTEIAELPAELESYYARYFTSRQAVVRFARSYQDAFTTRQTAIDRYDAQLKAKEATIAADTTLLKERGATIESDRRELDRLRAAGDIPAYNAGVAPFNAKVTAYNDLLAETKALIEQYNKLVEERNAIAAQTAELQKAIDSSTLPGSQ